MFRRVTKCVFLLGLALAIAGCKLEVIVPSGGDVRDESGDIHCAGGGLCEHNIVDLTFNKTFRAIARPGYVFTKWKQGPGFLCGDSTDPVCKVSLVGIPEGDAAVKALLASGHISYVMPLFKFVGIDTDGDGIADHLDEDDDNDGFLDVNDTCLRDPNPECTVESIVVNGREWAQPFQFGTESDLSWSDVKAVCPEGLCNGTLKGHDITGWTWATADDVGKLFLYYHGDNAVNLQEFRWSMVNSPWAPEFFSAGWIPTFACPEDNCMPGVKSASGYLYGPVPEYPCEEYGRCYIHIAYMTDQLDPQSADSFSYGIQLVPYGQSMRMGDSGVWLFRD